MISAGEGFFESLMNVARVTSPVIMAYEYFTSDEPAEEKPQPVKKGIKEHATRVADAAAAAAKSPPAQLYDAQTLVRNAQRFSVWTPGMKPDGSFERGVPKELGEAITGTTYSHPYEDISGFAVFYKEAMTSNDPEDADQRKALKGLLERQISKYQRHIKHYEAALAKYKGKHKERIQENLNMHKDYCASLTELRDNPQKVDLQAKGLVPLDLEKLPPTPPAASGQRVASAYPSQGSSGRRRSKPVKRRKLPDVSNL